MTALAATLFAAPTMANPVLVSDAAEFEIISLGPDKCKSWDHHVVGGSWGYDCTGVNGSGCVGSWGASGTHDANKKHITTYSYSDVVCPLIAYHTNLDSTAAVFVA